MKITFNSLALVFGALSVAASATQNTFRPRVWRHYRSNIPLDVYMEIDSSSGDAVIYKTPNHPGIESYINDPLQQTPPKGPLIHEDGSDTYTGYLVPLPGVTSNPPTSNVHYQLRFSKTPITDAGVLSTGFTTAYRMCGGNCFGKNLEHEVANGGYGQWYVIKEDEALLEYKVRWTAIPNGEPPYIPEGALSAVYVWV